LRTPDIEDITMTTQNDARRSETGRVDDLEPSQALQLNRSPIVVRYLAAVIMTALATSVAVGLDTKVTIPNLSLIFVIPVVVASVTFGLGPSLCSAVLGALAYNFFLTEPRYSLEKHMGNRLTFHCWMYHKCGSVNRAAQSGRCTAAETTSSSTAAL
jgi:K+-sensing histidine kinase KdpD